MALTVESDDAETFYPAVGDARGGKKLVSDDQCRERNRDNLLFGLLHTLAKDVGHALEHVQTLHRERQDPVRRILRLAQHRAPLLSAAATPARRTVRILHYLRPRRTSIAQGSHTRSSRVPASLNRASPLDWQSEDALPNVALGLLGEGDASVLGDDFDDFADGFDDIVLDLGEMGGGGGGDEGVGGGGGGAVTLEREDEVAEGVDLVVEVCRSVLR